MFNTELQIVGTQVMEVPEDSNQEYIEVGVVEGSMVPIQLPIQDPQNPGQPIVIPVQIVNGMYRFAIDKKSGLEFCDKMKIELDKLPDPKEDSGLIIAGNVGQANHMAEQVTQVTKSLRG